MKHRIILLSDMHYTTDLSAAELKKSFPDARASVASGTAFGYTQRQKTDFTVGDVLAEHESSPLDAVLILGDLSIDDWDYRNLPENYCEKYRDESMSRLPCPAYALPGNHDSYPDGMWREMFGCPRQYDIVIGGCLFIMADNFRDLPAHGASGGGYTPADTDFIRASLERHPDTPAFICTHHVSMHECDREFEEFLASEKRIAAVFRGHTHKNGVFRFGGKPLIDIGGYGYDGRCVDGVWDFNVFDPSWAWGYEVLEWDENGFSYRHIKPARHYVGTNGVFDMPFTLSGEGSGIFPR